MFTFSLPRDHPGMGEDMAKDIHRNIQRKPLPEQLADLKQMGENFGVAMVFAAPEPEASKAERKALCNKGPPSLRVFPLFAFTSSAQGSSGAVATMPFVWRSHAKSPTTRAGRALDIASWLE